MTHASVIAITRLGPKALLAKVRDLWPAFNRASWEFALLLYRIDETEAYRPLKSVTAFALREFRISSGTVSKYRSAAAALVQLPPADIDAALRIPPMTFYESRLVDAVRKDPKRAMRQAPKLLAATHTARAGRLVDSLVNRGDAANATPSKLPKGVSEIVDVFCTATTLIERGLPENPAIEHWFERLGAAVDQRRKDRRPT